MTDLNDFFAKKDKKKKAKPCKVTPATLKQSLNDSKSQAKVDTGSTTDTNINHSTSISSASSSHPPNQQPSSSLDTGWVDFEEAKTASVHTGGKSIVDLKDQDLQQENSEYSIKSKADHFQGWGNVSNVIEEQQKQAQKDAISIAEQPASSAPKKYVPPSQRSKVDVSLEDTRNFPTLGEAAKYPNPQVHYAQPRNVLLDGAQGGKLQNNNRFAGLASDLRKIMDENE